jgi:hypothetical protein
MLGALEEYVTSVRPRDVLWFYFEWNDLRELHEELQFEPLRQYLDPWSSQQLDQRAGEIDLALLAFLDGQITRYQGRRGAVAPGTRIPSRPFVEWARLQRLRKALALDGIRNRLDLCCDLETFGVERSKTECGVVGRAPSFRLFTGSAEVPSADVRCSR